MSIVHINAPLPVEKRIHRLKCPDCKKNTFFVSFYYEWYGASSTCLKCGRRYNDGEWVTLPFYRYARRDNINNTKKYYRFLAVSTIVQQPQSDIKTAPCGKR